MYGGVTVGKWPAFWWRESPERPLECFGQNSAFVSSRLPNSPSVTVSSTPAGTDTDARARGATLAQTHVNARAPSAIQLSGLELWQSS